MEKNENKIIQQQAKTQRIIELKSNKRKGKINKEKATIEIAHLIKRLDSLTIKNKKRLFSFKRENKGGVSLSKKNRGVATNIYLWKMLEKPKR